MTTLRVRVPADGPRSTLLRGAAFAAALVAAAGPAPAQAPQGGRVVHGAAAIEEVGAATRIRQASDRAVIDWRSFDVGPRREVRFEQPGPGSATLNRVQAGGPESTIAGAMTAPGTVVIQNTSGVVLTRTARVDVGAFVAASQRVEPGPFMASGRLAIGGGEAPGARVVNAGAITAREAGLVGLVGARVANEGTITASRGTVLIASGRRTTIDLDGDGLIRFAVEGDAAAAGPAGVANRGVIDAPGGRVHMTAGAAAGLLDAAVNTTGVVRAASASGRGGTIELVGRGDRGTVAVAGELDASGGAQGGRVSIAGAAVEVAAGARLAARGGAGGGGTIRVGAARPGLGAPDRPREIRLERGAVVDAGSAAGPGGRVAVTGGAVRVEGSILADGAARGGRVTTAGAGRLDVGTAAEVRPGAGGGWALRSGGDVPVVGGGGGRGAGGVAAPVLARALDGGADVTVAARGGIAVDAALRWSGDGSLALRGGGGVRARASIEARGGGSVRLAAAAGDVAFGAAGAGGALLSTARGNLTLSAPNGSVLVGPTGPGASGPTRVSAGGGGALTAEAGRDVVVAGGDAAGAWTRLGRADDGGGARVGLAAAGAVRVLGGTAPGADARVEAGAGGALRIRAGGAIEVRDGDSPAAVRALHGAALDMAAPEQAWAGLVAAAGSAAAGRGGPVRLQGAILASVAPEFDLGEGSTFRLGLPGGTGLPTSFTGAGVPFRVVARDRAGERIRIDGPVRAPSVVLQARGRVGLGAPVTGTGPGDAVVVVAPRGLENGAGPDALRAAAPGARWLLYLGRLDGVRGDAPGDIALNLYGRRFGADRPADLGSLPGNLVLHRQRPTLTLAAGTTEKVYGESAAAPGVVATGLRPGDSLATALAGAPAVASAGTAADAAAGAYPAVVAASASAQGYRVATADGLVLVRPAPLTVRVADAERAEGAPDPGFVLLYEGLRLGDTPAALSGAPAFSTAAGPSSPPGPYAVVAGGLAARNYAITYVPGTLTVLPAAAAPPSGPTGPAAPGPAAPGPAAPGPAAGGAVPAATAAPPAPARVGLPDVVEPTRRGLARGAAPNTPGDAAFRTTPAEAAPAAGSPFGLEYSLGTVAQDAGADAAASRGFVPAATGSGPPAASCGGPVNVGAAGGGAGCARTEAREGFWDTFRATGAGAGAGR